VFADGTTTLANRRLKIGFQMQPECTSLAAAVYVNWQHNPSDSLNFFVSNDVSPFGYGWIFPKKDSINVGVMCLLSRMKQDIRQCLKRLMISEGLCSREILMYGSRFIPQSFAKKLFDDSLLVIGDAAGTADPITGGGISNAAASAKIAASVVTEALEAQETTADVLSRYESMWKNTRNYRNLMNKYWIQKLSLKTGINPIIFARLGGSDLNTSLKRLSASSKGL